MGNVIWWILGPMMVGFYFWELSIIQMILGDTALNLAEASDGGTVVAFEMGPPVNLLNINKK